MENPNFNLGFIQKSLDKKELRLESSKLSADDVIIIENCKESIRKEVFYKVKIKKNNSIQIHFICNFCFHRRAYLTLPSDHGQRDIVSAHYYYCEFLNSEKKRILSSNWSLFRHEISDMSIPEQLVGKQRSHKDYKGQNCTYYLFPRDMSEIFTEKGVFFKNNYIGHAFGDDSEVDHMQQKLVKKDFTGRIDYETEICVPFFYSKDQNKTANMEAVGIVFQGLSRNARNKSWELLPLHKLDQKSFKIYANSLFFVMNKFAQSLMENARRHQAFEERKKIGHDRLIAKTHAEIDLKIGPTVQKINLPRGILMTSSMQDKFLNNEKAQMLLQKAFSEIGLGENNE